MFYHFSIDKGLPCNEPSWLSALWLLAHSSIKHRNFNRNWNIVGLQSSLLLIDRHASFSSPASGTCQPSRRRSRLSASCSRTGAILPELCCPIGCDHMVLDFVQGEERGSRAIGTSQFPMMAFIIISACCLYS